MTNAEAASTDTLEKNTGSEDRLEAVGKIISSSAMWSGATGAIPIPIVDIGALAAVQATMISRIASLYGESLNSEAARSIISILLGTLIPAGAAFTIAKSGVKLIPGAGYLIGTVSMIGLSAAATYAIGKIFVRHFEGGGSLTSFDAGSVTEDLKAEFSKARSKSAPA